MVRRYTLDGDKGEMFLNPLGWYVRYSKYADLEDQNKELEAENDRLRQQRDAANAQLDFLIEEMKKAP